MKNEEEHEGGTTINDIAMSSVDGISRSFLPPQPPQDPLG